MNNDMVTLSARRAISMYWLLSTIRFEWPILTIIQEQIIKLILNIFSLLKITLKYVFPILINISLMKIKKGGSQRGK